MQIQINPDHVEVTERLADEVDQEVTKAIGHHVERVTRVEVHLQDENGPKGGVDKHCVMEARLAGDKPVTVNGESDELAKAIHQTAGKLGRAVDHRIEREKARHQ